MRALLIILFFTMGCTHPYKPIIKSGYYDINDDNYNEMTLWLHVKKDSVFLYYCNIVDNGNYLNCPASTTDYVGVFLLSEIHNATVQVKIKNYRNEKEYTRVKLTFRDKDIDWTIQSNYFGYLPENAKFSFRK